VKTLRTTVRTAAFAAAALIAFHRQLPAQEASTDTATAVRELQDQVRQLRSLVEQMHAENVQSRAEMQELREDLKATRALLATPGANAPGVATAAQGTPPLSSDNSSSAPLESRVEKLEESTSLLNSRIDEHYQTKVETASKYRARLHGIVLMNTFRNLGGSNDLDIPEFATPVSRFASQTTFGATLRQSEIGLEIFGPDVAGARTSANIQLDFAGGFPSVGNGVNFGIARLQTANMRFDWAHTSVIAGQDSLFISPLSPASFATLAIPTFAAAGNLWSWTPQIRVEHRFEFSDQHYITVQAGILDNLNWEPPQDSYARNPQAGEESGQPAYGVRTAWTHPLFGRPLTVGAAGYYGRQHWSWDRYVDSWAGMTDWQIPLAPRLMLSGEFYRGRGVGTFGAAINRPVLFGGSPFSGLTPIRGLDSAGGWGQLTLQIAPKLDFNGSFAEDNAYAGDIRGFATDENNFSTILGRNRGMLGNFVYRPRSDLLFSAEFRRLRSYPVYSDSSMTNQIGLAMGILF